MIITVPLRTQIFRRGVRRKRLRERYNRDSKLEASVRTPGVLLKTNRFYPPEGLVTMTTPDATDQSGLQVKASERQYRGKTEASGNCWLWGRMAP